MNECQSVLETEPFRQGDIFFSSSSQGNESERLNVLITADCDIAQNKAGPVLTWLPVIPAETFVRSFWVSEKLGRLRTTLTGRLAGRVNKMHSDRDPENLPLDEQFVLDWVQSDDGAGLCSTLAASEADRTEVSTLLGALAQLEADQLSIQPFSALVDLFYDLPVEVGLAQAAPQPKRRGVDVETVLRDARLDAFFLSSLPGEVSEWLDR